MKPTGWLSNSSHILERVARRCCGARAHQPIVKGMAKATERYSPQLVTAILLVCVTNFAEEIMLGELTLWRVFLPWKSRLHG